MTKRLLWVALCMAALMSFVLPLSAQELVELVDGYSIELPDGWTVEASEDGLGVYLYSPDEEVYVYVLAPTEVDAVLDGETVADATEALQAVILTLYEFEVDADEITALPGFGIYEETVTWFYFSEGAGGMVTAVAIKDHGYLVMDAYGETLTEYLFEVSGLSYALEVPDEKPVVTQDEEEETDSVASGEPCLVSATSADSSRMRVGPGENRSAIAFLPVDDAFTVTGTFTTDDDELWYQLDKAEVAPDSSAAELWVSQAEIEESGDCDLVASAAAPPIIPGAQRPPATTGGSTGGDSGGTTDTSIVPAAGRWTFNFDATTLASCAGTNTISFPTTDVLVSLSSVENLTVSNGGQTLSLGGVPITMTAPGNYVGSADFGGGTNGQLYLFVGSSSAMSGKYVFNFAFNGRSCSATIPLSASKS